MEAALSVYLFLGIIIALIALILCIYTLMERRKLEQSARNLGGKWTWTYSLGTDGVPFIVIKLWPDLSDAHTAQIMNAATFFQLWATPQGQPLCYYEDTAGFLKIPFYQLILMNRQQAVPRAVQQPQRPTQRT